jgi:hypothetical protein
VNNTNSAPTDVNTNWTKVLTFGTLPAYPTLNSLLPSQTGNAGKLLTTDGTNASWGNVPFASVLFDSTTASNLTGTFTRTLAVVTANVTAHGHIVGHRIYFVGAGVTSGWYTVATVSDANTFTFDSGVSGGIGSTSCTLQRRSIRQSVNVQSVPYESAGATAVNFTTTPADANYRLVGSSSGRSGTDHLGIVGFHRSNTGFVAPTVNAFHTLIRNQGASAVDQTDVSIAVFT